MGNANETLIEKIASSTTLDKWAAIVACVALLAQTIGLVCGVDLFRSIPTEALFGAFAAVAAVRRKLVNGKGVRERSVESLPIPASMAAIPKRVPDEVTEPIDIPPELAVVLESEHDTLPPEDGRG